MDKICFVSDLHGHPYRYQSLLEHLRSYKTDALFIGGDLLPHFSRRLSEQDFIIDYMIPQFRELRDHLGDAYPAVFLILGNDDPRTEEVGLITGQDQGLWQYMHNRKAMFQAFSVYGYACIPPSPFRLKDWERYDVSRYVDPGCTHPTEGVHTLETGEDLEQTTIQKDLDKLTGDDDLSKAILLFHTPPYQTKLDRAALDGQMVDHVPLDVHVGSIAVKRFIESRQPFITLHGHIHESTRLTGAWHEQIGSTHAYNAATEQKALSIIEIPLNDPSRAELKMIREKEK